MDAWEIFSLFRYIAIMLYFAGCVYNLSQPFTSEVCFTTDATGEHEVYTYLGILRHIIVPYGFACNVCYTAWSIGYECGSCVHSPTLETTKTTKTTKTTTKSTESLSCFTKETLKTTTLKKKGEELEIVVEVRERCGLPEAGDGVGWSFAE